MITLIPDWMYLNETRREEDNTCDASAKRRKKITYFQITFQIKPKTSSLILEIL
jgi:hypothetical protein